GEWEIDTDHATGDMSGENWQCDSDAHPGSPYQAETLSPWFRVGSADTVTCEFDTWFSPMDTGDYASFGCYCPDYYQMFFEAFHDLGDWYASEDGTNVVETSWGAIKASF
ncbi:hypothetical protein KAU45_03065, partial [bacterium]|nr:hypothetical protein [bacterium]